MDTMELANKIGDYDLAAALNYNISGWLDRIESIEYKLVGVADELPWHWICRLVDEKWAYITGSCDYTGWD